MYAGCWATLDRLLAETAARVESHLEQWTAGPDVPAELAEAMRYAVLGGGKRLRPAMVLLAARAVHSGGRLPADPLPAAVAMELVHTYSLVHDDLPAMDDDDLRRGRPTVHVRYGQAMAILVGDALLTEAFSLLARRVADPAVAIALVGELARGAGAEGMIAGQVADMALCRLPDGQAGLDYIHTRKTAALFAAAARMGARCGGADDDQLRRLGAFGFDVGLAFQAADDLLDATSTSEQLGKTAGKDVAAGKRTYPAVLGLDATAARIRELTDQAVEHLAGFGSEADPLRALAERLRERTH
ncbi:MAG: polyprenyl synthetase family protein [Planctomycetes bacterium]|nr:polyprenyl synthetase family protein [Planctomycetota bacterium]